MLKMRYNIYIILNCICHLFIFTEGSNVTQNPHDVPKTTQNIKSLTSMLISLPEQCKCQQDVNVYEKGNCSTKSLKFGWREWCYVIQPSNCTDLENSTFHKDKGIHQQYSAEACSPSKGISICRINKNAAR